MKIAVSACLLGDKVRYDGKDKLNKELVELLKNHDVIKICPEVASGFSIPRKPMEMKDNKVINIDNQDLTKQLINGCNICLKMIDDCDFLVLKSKSPTCGYQAIYDGSFTSTLTNKNGLFSQMVLDRGFTIYSEKDIEILRKILQ